MNDPMVPRALVKNIIVAIVCSSTIVFIGYQTNYRMNNVIPAPLIQEIVVSPIAHRMESLGREERGKMIQLMDRRSKRLEDSCQKIKKLPKFRRKGGNLTDENVHFCTVTKVGSTFLKSLFKEYKRVKYANLPNQKRTKHLKRTKNTTGKTQHIVFVRDPYRKLFSAYIDKLFSPNPDFWAAIGRPIVRRQRHDYDAKCGSDVSFSEFVDEIIYLDKNHLPIDQHFKPLHGYCDFCNVHYKFIGKMETLVQDVIYLSNTLGAINDNGFKKFLNKSLLGGPEVIMKRCANNIFGYRLKSILRCNVSLLDALKTTWKRWQIVGYIERRFSFPENSTSTFPEFISRSIELHRASNKATLAASKRSFLSEFYSTLSNEQKEKLMEMFKPQFDMFGYDPRPDYVFGNQ